MQGTLSDHLQRWSNQLQELSDSARLDAEVILKHVAKLSDTQIISLSDQALETGIISAVDSLIEARRRGKPIAHIVGQREFYSLELKVNEHVLIPRPETELLVETALKRIARSDVQTLLDLGTGSGAIALAIARHAPTTCITALEKDPKALQIARQNAQRLEIDNIRFTESNWYTALKNSQQKFDLIVANPPYIAPQDPHLLQGDLRFEPTQALVASEHGLADLKHIIKHAPPYLHTDAWMIVEHGYDQGIAVGEIFEAAGFCEICTQKDLAGHDRISFGKIEHG